MPATAVCGPVGADVVDFDVVCGAAFAAAFGAAVVAGFGALFAAVPPVASWTRAFAASLAVAAPLAAVTSLASPVVPGAAGSGASAAGGLGRSTVNHSAHAASMATTAMRKGGLIWLTAHASDAAAGT